MNADGFLGSTMFGLAWTALGPFIIGNALLSPPAAGDCGGSPSTVEADIEQFNMQLWNLAWGLAWSPDRSTMSLEQEASGDWRVDVWFDDQLDYTMATEEEVFDQIVAQGWFIPSVWRPIGIAQDQTVEDDGSTTFIEIEAFVIAGEIVGSTGFQAPIFGYVSESFVSNDAVAGNEVTVRHFLPVTFTQSVAEAAACANEVADAISGSGGGGRGFPEPTAVVSGGAITASGGTYFPCEVGVPYEDQSCECQCAIDRGILEENCAITLRNDIISCLRTWAAAAAAVCVTACLAAPIPLFLKVPCVILAIDICGQAAFLPCLEIARGNFQICMNNALLEYHDCLRDCGSTGTPSK